MPRPGPVPGTVAAAPGDPERGEGPAVSAAKGSIDPARAAQGPTIEAVSVIADAAPTPRTGTPAVDTPAEVRGRRILSTAFVRVGPDDLLTVERHDGRVLILRGVALRARTYSGAVVHGAPDGKYTGGYAEVAAARAGGAPAPATPDPVAPDMPARPRDPGHP